MAPFSDTFRAREGCLTLRYHKTCPVRSPDRKNLKGPGASESDGLGGEFVPENGRTGA